jgi:hypothetical protein
MSRLHLALFQLSVGVWAVQADSGKTDRSVHDDHIPAKVDPATDVPAIVV